MTSDYVPLVSHLNSVSCSVFFLNACSPLTHRLFKQKVSISKSSVKISDQVDRNNPKLIEAVFWSSLLDNVFKENLENDPELRYVITHLIDQIYYITSTSNLQCAGPENIHTPPT